MTYGTFFVNLPITLGREVRRRFIDMISTVNSDILGELAWGWPIHTPVFGLCIAV